MRIKLANIMFPSETFPESLLSKSSGRDPFSNGQLLNDLPNDWFTKPYVLGLTPVRNSLGLDRKEQILDVAEELLQTRSFSSVSYQDLSDRIGISKASIHHHFPSKDDLCLALVTRHRTIFSETLEKILQEEKTPWKQLEAYFLLVSKTMQSGRKICLTGSLQSELNIISHDSRHELTAHCKYVHGWLASILRQGERQQSMRFPGTPEDQATLIQAALQGALQQARAQNPKQFTTVIRQIKLMLKG